MHKDAALLSLATPGDIATLTETAFLYKENIMIITSALPNQEVFELVQSENFSNKLF